MSAELTPRVGTSVTGKGRVMSHQVSRKGLHTAVVELAGGYPDLETWIRMLPEGVRLVSHNYTEKAGLVFVGYLWLFWKETSNG